MAHGIGADVVCEGVETHEQLQRLRELGVRYAQGYLIGQAQPAAAVLSGEAARAMARAAPQTGLSATSAACGPLGAATQPSRRDST